MAGKFVELNEAAKQLGVSVEKLKEMHSAGEIHGYRDGASIKFKPEELARVAEELGGGASSSSSDIIEARFDSGSMDDLLAPSESSGSIGADELILDDSDPGEQPAGGSTVIGKKGTSHPMDSGSDLRIAGDSALGLPKAGGSSKKIGSDILGRKAIDKPADDDDSGELRLAPDEGSSDDLLDAGSGKLLPTDSGINLKSPVDSGLSLESDALELSGAPQDSHDSFELLPEEDSDFAAVSDSEGDVSSIEDLSASEAFELAPSDASGFDESSDSGSQIIALEESDSFEAAPLESAESVDFSSMESAAPVEGLGDAFEGDALGADAFAAVAAPAEGTNAAIASEVSQLWAAPKEAPYSTISVVSLGLTTLLMLLTCLIMTDVMFNMWAASTERSYSSGITDLVASFLPEK